MSHRIELAKSTNTGKLVACMLGERARLVSSDSTWESHANPSDSWVLFPSDDALPLEHVAEEVESLIVPDGTWGQARRMARRHSHCKNLNRVRLTSPLHSAYTMRRSQTEARLCTFEAIAYALRILEGDALSDLMLEAFKKWVENALLVRNGAHNLPTIRDN